MASHTRPNRPPLRKTSSRSSTHRYSIYPPEFYNSKSANPHYGIRSAIQTPPALTSGQGVSTTPEAPEQPLDAPALGLNIRTSAQSQRPPFRAGDILTAPEKQSSQRKTSWTTSSHQPPKEYPWALFKICIRGLTTILSIALLVLNTLAGIFLPRGAEWDLLWDVLFPVVLVINALALMTAIQRRRKPLLPRTQSARVIHYLIILLDFLTFAALATFSLFDGVYILHTNWHFLLLSDGNAHSSSGFEPAVLENEISHLVQGTSDASPQEFADMYEKWVLVAVAACIVGGALAADHLLLAILEFMEYRAFRRSEKAVEARYFGRSRTGGTQDGLFEMLRRVEDKVGVFPSDEVVAEGYGEFDDVKLDEGQAPGELYEAEARDV